MTTNPTFRSYVGVAKETGHGITTAALSSSATSITVTNDAGFVASGSVVIYDPAANGANTEVVAVSAWNSGTHTLTVGATAHAHPIGCYVTTATAPTDYIPIKTVSPADLITYLDDNGMRGSMAKVFGTVAGPMHATFDLDGDVFPDTFGYLICNLLGDVTTTGSGAPYTHAASVKNSGDAQPTPLTFFFYDVIETRAFPGALVTDIDVKFTASGLLGYSAKTITYPSGIVANPTASFTTVTPIANWAGAASIAGTVVQYVLDGDVQLKRAAEAVTTVQAQVPYRVHGGPVEVSGKLTAVMGDDTELNRYLANSQPTLDLSFTQGTGAALNGLILHSTTAAYKTAPINTGKDYTVLDITFDAIANTTDQGASGGYSPVKATVKSAKVSGTYQ